MNNKYHEALRLNRVSFHSSEERWQPMITEQTTELRKANEQLEAIKQELQQEISQRKLLEQKLDAREARLQHTQSQLVQNGKMVSLGQLVAGVAHEINNPTSFIYGNIQPAQEYARDLLYLLQLYTKHYPNPVPEIAEQIESIDSDFIAEDFPKVLTSMKEGAERICELVMSLRNFSRLKEAESEQVDIHEGIDNTLLILHHRLKQKPGRPEIKVIKEYGQLPLVECYPGQLNQVFMNLLCNAIDSLEVGLGKERPNRQLPTIRIRTEVVEQNRVVIRIADNGSGMKPDVRLQIFDPFFTTKPPGEGTGLGLSISYKIVVDKHNGQLTCHSTVGEGTEFAIALPIESEHST